MGANASSTNGASCGGAAVVSQPPDLAPRLPLPHDSIEGTNTQKTPKRKNLSSGPNSGGTVSLFTLRKRLLIKGRRRTSKLYDHSQVFHDFLAEWVPRDVASLVREYEAGAALRELVQQADNARPLANSCRKDLASLFESKVCADITLVYRGQSFATHRAVLSVRCPFFRELLSDPALTLGSIVVVEIDIPGVHTDMFNDLLRYLYTGELSVSSSSANYEGSLSTLVQLSEQFGIPNPLEQDLRHLLDAEIFSDALLVFSSENNFPSQRSGNECSAAGGASEYCKWCTNHNSAQSQTPPIASQQIQLQQQTVIEFPCHRALLAARSPFLRNVILRQQRRFAEQGLLYASRSSGSAQHHRQQVTRITLDRNVVPIRFAKLLLASLYQDNVDFSSLLTAVPSSNSKDGSSGGGSGGDGTGAQQRHFVKELTELYQFLNLLNWILLPKLYFYILDCEDVIVELLSPETLTSILAWSEQPHGSAWVHKQALAYIRDEFSTIANSSVLHQLTEQQLIQVLNSDYVQASELEILAAVIRWGEHQLLKKIDGKDSESKSGALTSSNSNNNNNPSNSSSNRNSKALLLRRKEMMDDCELRVLLSKLLTLVRTDHILPPQSDVLLSAVKRGLLKAPPSSCYMIGDDSCIGIGGSAMKRGRAWIRGRNSCCSMYVRPRYFTPYVEAAKAFLESSSEARHYHHTISSCAYYSNTNTIAYGGSSTNYPDNLYMLEPGYGRNAGNDHLGGSTPGLLNADDEQNESSGRRSGDLSNTGAASSCSTLLVAPDDDTLRKLKRRENELKCCQTACRAYALVANRCEVTRQIQLRVVREEGLPDESVDALARFVDHHNHSVSSAQSAADISRRTNVLSTFGTLRNRHYTNEPMQQHVSTTGLGSTNPNGSLSLVYGPASTRYSGVASSTSSANMAPAQRMSRAERLYGTISRSAALGSESAAWFVERATAAAPSSGIHRTGSTSHHGTSASATLNRYQQQQLSSLHAYASPPPVPLHAPGATGVGGRVLSPSRALSLYGTTVRSVSAGSSGERKKMASASLCQVQPDLHRSQDNRLSDIIPDIAMASSSMLERLSVSNADKDLPPNVLL